MPNNNTFKACVFTYWYGAQYMSLLLVLANHLSGLLSYTSSLLKSGVCHAHSTWAHWFTDEHWGTEDLRDTAAPAREKVWCVMCRPSVWPLERWVNRAAPGCSVKILTPHIDRHNLVKIEKKKKKAQRFIFKESPWPCYPFRKLSKYESGKTSLHTPLSHAITK